MEHRCDYVWPSNGQVCGNTLVKTDDECLEVDDCTLVYWVRNRGYEILIKARNNPNRYICPYCGHIPNQLFLPFDQFTPLIF